MKTSAGLLPYHIYNAHIMVMLVHPGGPFYAGKDKGVWSVPKGEYTFEEPLEVAKREFYEETGNFVTSESFISLNQVVLKSGKIIRAWAMKCDSKLLFIESNTFNLEWPPKSGKTKSFPEVDKAEWFTIEEALIKIHPGQVEFLDRLVFALAG
ncbi:MAG TPA: NUDIX domain-containing protein [Pedobacter sp.]|jgi:predicted NUDIX family NTP pyrophosphohydrolase